MTNSEYEAASIAAANASLRFEGEHKLKQCDKAIAVLEESLARLQVERREIVNRYDLNKCEHHWLDVTYLGCKTAEQVCGECRMKRSTEDDQHAHMVD